MRKFNSFLINFAIFHLKGCGRYYNMIDFHKNSNSSHNWLRIKRDSRDFIYKEKCLYGFTHICWWRQKNVRIKSLAPKLNSLINWLNIFLGFLNADLIFRKSSDKTYKGKFSKKKNWRDLITKHYFFRISIG